jgi:hypothetical protein
MEEISLRHKKIAFILILVMFLLFTITFTAFAKQEVINENCEINWEIFNRDWKKYSDMDERFSFAELNLSSRSWETQQYYRIQERIVDLKLQIYFLERDMEIDRQMRLALRDYKNRLVKNIKVNLLKSFWRMAYVTYDTIKTGKGLGSSYTKLFTSAEVIPKIGASLKVIKGLTPKVPKSEKNINDITSKVKSVAVSGVLEAVESLVDPFETGKAVYNEAVKQVLPSADLTAEEIKILQDQHLNNRIITQVLEESYRVNLERVKKVQQFEEQVQKLEKEMIEWETEEKKRVADMLVHSCQKNLQKSEPMLETTYPKELYECETYEVEICGTWTLKNGKYNALWDNGAKAVIDIVRFNENKVAFSRHDTTGSSAGLHADYEGDREGRKVKGTVKWTWNNKNWEGTWSATW